MTSTISAASAAATQPLPGAGSIPPTTTALAVDAPVQAVAAASLNQDGGGVPAQAQAPVLRMQPAHFTQISESHMEQKWALIAKERYALYIAAKNPAPAESGGSKESGWSFSAVASWAKAKLTGSAQPESKGEPVSEPVMPVVNLEKLAMDYLEAAFIRLYYTDSLEGLFRTAANNIEIGNPEVDATPSLESVRIKQVTKDNPDIFLDPVKENYDQLKAFFGFSLPLLHRMMSNDEVGTLNQGRLAQDEARYGTDHCIKFFKNLSAACAGNLYAIEKMHFPNAKPPSHLLTALGFTYDDTSNELVINTEKIPLMQAAIARYDENREQLSELFTVMHHTYAESTAQQQALETATFTLDQRTAHIHLMQETIRISLETKTAFLTILFS
ncbi:hypothetical protein COB21_00260 [Candidatus Aerophobetes bacterium]|uniref:Uncharacterized protein n=1 Tax=Aerophobetes bacterium TaxID=2030807 RepID=A0A2A4X7P4_UNCAE|nr:MAG: hypothetical protein COB21_00260 [Candidatus Aerophobetes bacterium]